MTRARLIAGTPLLALPILLVPYLNGEGLSTLGLWTFAVADGIGLIGGAIGLALHRPRYLTPWLCMLAVAGWSVVADIAVTVGGMIDWAGVLFLPRYPLGVLALLLWVRRRHPGRDLATWIDLTVVTVALGLLSWVFLVAPQLGLDDHRAWAAGTTIGFPVINLIQTSLGLRIWLGARDRTASLYLLSAVFLAWLTADVAFSLFTVTGQAAVSDLWNMLFLIPGPLLAAAALHPSMVTMDRAVPPSSKEVSGQRLVVLAVVAAVPPGVLVVQHLRGVAPDALAIAAACTVLTSLVLARMWLLVIEQRRIAVTDSLTGLKTRRRFEEELSSRYGRSRDVGVMLLDVDHFKQVNDVYGHQAGDAVLGELSLRLTQAVRAGDLVARYGGEEFAVLLGSTDYETARTIAERTRQSVADRPFVLDGGLELPITVSIGIAIWTSELSTADSPELLREADRRLYKAKAAGRNMVISG